MKEERPVGADIPVDVTIRSDQEPVETRGIYRRLVGGFELEFDIGEGKYVVTSIDGRTKLVVNGLMSYALDFSAQGRAELKTPFGSMMYDFEPVTCDSSAVGENLDLLLVYKLSAPETGEMTRSVGISARGISCAEQLR